MNNPRNIKNIVVHCTATPTNTTLESIQRYWKEQRGWNDTPGYHYIIMRDGEVIPLLDESKFSYGSYGHNQNSIHLAYLGGIDKNGKPMDNRTERQKEAMFNLIVSLSVKYPKAETLGHRDFPEVKKACPSFDVKAWLATYTPSVIKKN